MIEIKNITKSFDDKKVLHGISGKFEKGKTNLIIGASGTGKSVLLKCLVGLYFWMIRYNKRKVKQIVILLAFSC